MGRKKGSTLPYAPFSGSYYNEHRDERLEYQRNYYYAHRTERLRYQKERYYRKRSELLAYQRRYNHMLCDRWGNA